MRGWGGGSTEEAGARALSPPALRSSGRKERLLVTPISRALGGFLAPCTQDFTSPTVGPKGSGACQARLRGHPRRRLSPSQSCLPPN